MIHETNTDSKIDFPLEEIKKNPDLEKSSESVGEFKDSLTRLKEARALKAEKKKAVKEMTVKFGNVKMAKRLVKTAVSSLRNKVRRTSGRGR